MLGPRALDPQRSSQLVRNLHPDAKTSSGCGCAIQGRVRRRPCACLRAPTRTGEVSCQSRPFRTVPCPSPERAQSSRRANIELVKMVLGPRSLDAPRSEARRIGLPGPTRQGRPLGPDHDPLPLTAPSRRRGEPICGVRVIVLIAGRRVRVLQPDGSKPILERRPIIFPVGGEANCHGATLNP